MQALGAPPEAMRAAQGRDEGEACEIWPENWDTVSAFAAMGTQWRIAAGMSGLAWLGLDYAALPAVLRLTGAPRAAWREIFAGLRIMERAALGVLNDRRQ